MNYLKSCAKVPNWTRKPRYRPEPHRPATVDELWKWYGELCGMQQEAFEACDFIDHARLTAECYDALQAAIRSGVTVEVEDEE